MSETTGEIVGETEGIYDGRLPELSYNEQEKDCLYMRVCGGDDACDFPSEAGTRWRNNNCSVVSAVNTQIYACQNPIGEQVNIGDAIHRELLECIYRYSVRVFNKASFNQPPCRVRRDGARISPATATCS